MRGGRKVKKVFIIVMVLMLCAGSAQAAQLTLSECIAAALASHPDLASSAAQIDSARATIGQNAADGNLQASAGSSYARGDSENSDSSGSYSSGVSLSQSIYDWGKRNLKVKGAKQNTEAASSDYMEMRDTVIANVKTAYYGLNDAVRQYAVAKTRYDNYVKRLDWAKSYYKVGTKAKIEVTKAESDLATSKLTLVQTSSSIAQNKATLASAMGAPMLVIDGVQDALGYQAWGISQDTAVQRAIASRPELAAQQQRVDYAKTNLELQKKGLTPDLSAGAGYTVGNSSAFEDNGWNAKLSLNVPLLDGGLTKSKVAGASADLRAAQAKLDSLSNSVMLEVRKAWQSLLEANESLTASQEAERSAKATLDLALGRYKAGVGDNLEISDAVEGYATAQSNTVTSLYNCKTARLNLERAMGGLEAK